MTRRGSWTVGILAALGLVAVSAVKMTAPTNPAPKVLQSMDIRVKPLIGRPGDISAQSAQVIARKAFEGINPLTRMATELVMFSNQRILRLQQPQPAWMVSWNQKSYPQGVVGPVKPYQHMNVVVNARTGQFLESFPTP